jgi:PEP-CTERM motif
MTACVGNFATNTTGWAGSTPHFQGQAQAANELTTVTPDLAINFNQNVFLASFLFAVPANSTVQNTYQIQLFNGATLVDSAFLHGTLGSSPYVQIQEGQSFNEILITQLTGANGYGANQASGTLGSNTTGVFTFNALIGDVQASTVAPEPATLGLLGLGLAGMGYIARRRKKA